MSFLASSVCRIATEDSKYDLKLQMIKFLMTRIEILKKDFEMDSEMITLLEKSQTALTACPETIDMYLGKPE